MSEVISFPNSEERDRRGTVVVTCDLLVSMGVAQATAQRLAAEIDEDLRAFDAELISLLAARIQIPQGLSGDVMTQLQLNAAAVKRTAVEAYYRRRIQSEVRRRTGLPTI